MSFSQLRINSDILQGLKDVNIESPSPLQKKIIKATQTGHDLLIKAARDDKPETGYLVPVLNHIARQDRRQGTKAILLTSSAERAEELDKWIWEAGTHAGIECVPVTANTEKSELKTALSKGPVFITATPEELAALIEENRMVFREVGFLIVDSADEILDWPSLQVIVKRIIGKCQRIVCLRDHYEKIADEIKQLLTDPELVGFEKPKKAEPDSNGQDDPEISRDLTQYYINVPPRLKISTLMAHLEKTPADHVVIFTASRRTADRLYRILRKNGRRAASIHGRLEKSTLDERFERFVQKNVQHLVVGEMSASELDLNDVTQVINYDVPEEIEEYKLRAELVGSGKASRMVSLVSRQDRSDIHEIIKKLGYAPEEVPLPETVDKKKDLRKGKDNGKDKPPKPAGKVKAKENEKRSASRDTRRSQRRPRPQQTQQSEGVGVPDGLPRPSYDKLSGGRSGRKMEEKSGIVGFFKKLFS